MGSPTGWVFSVEQQWTYNGQTGNERIFQVMVVDLNNALGDFSPVFTEIANDIFEPYTMARFASEGADIGGWQELAESTIKARERKMRRMLKTDVRHRAGQPSAAMGGLISALGFGLPILVESGALLESFQEGGVDHVQRIDKKQMEWGSADRIALWHQQGTGKGFGKARVETGPGTGRGMPRRQMVFISKEEAEEIRIRLVRRIGLITKQVGGSIARQTMGPAEAASLSATELGQIGNAAMTGGPGADLLSGM